MSDKRHTGTVGLGGLEDCQATFISGFLRIATEAMLLIDPEGIIVAANGRAYELFEYEEPELAGESLLVLIPERFRDIHRNHELSFFDHPKARRLGQEREFPGVTKSGAEIPLEISLSPLAPGEKLSACVVTCVDVSARKAAYEALNRSEAAYRSLFEGAPYGIYRVMENGEIVMANPALAHMLGYDSPADVVGLNTVADIYLDPKDREQLVAMWYRKQAVYPYDIRWKRKDGKRIVVRFSSIRPHGESNPRCFEVYVEEVTQQRLLEQQFQQAQRMEAIGKLAAGIAHDFNNLINVIENSASLIGKHISNPARIERHVEHITEASLRAAEITKQLMTFTCSQEVTMTAVAPNTVVQGLHRMLSHVLGDDIEIVFALNARHHIRADHTQIEQVLMNLAMNARDAMPSGGKFTIETSDVSIDRESADLAVKQGSYVSLLVADTGCGMTPEVREHIFEPFFTTKDGEHGTGLGLSAVYGIVSQSGGFILVDSETGRGTTFRIYFPVALPPESDSSTCLSGETSATASEILLVDSDQTFCDATAGYIRSLGYSVAQATSFDEALRMLRAQPKGVHLLITDTMVRGASGSQLAKLAREAHPGIRVVYTCGHVVGVGQNAAEESAILRKPFGLAVLASLIRESLK